MLQNKFLKSSVPSNSSEKGATMIEYALMIALIAVVALTAITSIGKAANESFTTVGNTLNQVNN